MSHDEEANDDRPTARGWASNTGLRTDDSGATRAIKIAILAAPWIVGVAVFWRQPTYLAIFLGVGILFAILQRRWPTPTKKSSRERDDHDAR